jgi:PAS domain S-box-containing protein
MSNRAAKKKDPDFSFINVLSATIAIINAEGEIVAVNEAWRKFAIENDFPNHSNAGVGTNYLDTCQKSLMNLNDAEAGRAIKGIQEVINGVRNTFTMVYPCHSPTVSRWFRMEVGMAEPDGPFFLIAHQDITDLRLALDSLRKSEEKFSKAFHSAPVLMTISTIEEGRCLDLNDAFSRITGFDRKKALGATATELGFLKSEDRRQILENLNHYGYARNLELDTIRKDGSIIPIEVNASFIRGDTGAPTGIIGTTRDITKRKQAEAALKESEARFKALHNASFGGIAIHDKGRIIECNKGLSAITGYAYQEMIGMDGLSLISDDTQEKVVLNISAGYEKPYEVNGVRKNGEVYPLRIEARNVPS